ncbi:MAG TPA: thiamine phosphate synthase [Burkholderiales bacterium]
MNRAGAIRGLYAIADTACLGAELSSKVEAALRGGARVVQYRDKSNDAARRRREAEALRALCARRGALFVVNDDIALARAVGADGLHLGRDDASIEEARALCGADILIGVSCYNELQRAEEAARRGADYLAFGSVFPSPTKPEAVRASPALLAAAKAQFALPVVAIGGITPENGAALVAAGVDALAVISALFAQADVEAAARRYAALFERAAAKP